MDGLLDFPVMQDPSSMSGLLSPQDMQTAKQMALLNLAGGMVRGDFGGGLLGAGQAYQQTQNNAVDRLDKMQQIGLRNMQLRQAQQQWEMMQPVFKAIQDAYSGQGGGQTQAPSQPAIPPTPGGPLGSGTFGIPIGGQSASAPPAASGPSGSVFGLPLNVAGPVLAMGGPAELAKTVSTYNAPTDFMKLLASSGIDPNGPLGRQLVQAQIAKLNNIPLQAGRAGAPMYNAQGQVVAMAPKIPDNAIPQIQDGRVVGVTPLPGGAAIQQTNAYAQAAGSAQTKPIKAFDVNNNPVFSNELAAARQGDALPPAQPGVTGNFVGNPSDVAMAIGQIKDPQERANAQAAFEQQMRTSGGQLRPELSPTQQKLTDIGSQYFDTAAKDRQAVPMLRQTLEEISKLAENPNNTFGPGTPEIARLKALASNIPGIDWTQAQTAQDIFGKLAANIVMTQLGQGGQTGTDAQMNQIIHSTPNGGMTNAAIKQVVPLLQQQLDVRDARANVLQNAVQKSGNFSTLPTVANQFNRLASPPVVQLGMQLAAATRNGTTKQFVQSLTPQQRALLPTVRQLDQLGAF